MARKVASFRLDVDLLGEVEAYAKSRGSSQGQVMEAAARAFLELAKTGVPDLPVVDTPVVKAKRAAAVVSDREAKLQIARDMGWSA